MKKNEIRKDRQLRLDKKTIRPLVDPQLEQVAGGLRRNSDDRVYSCGQTVARCD